MPTPLPVDFWVQEKEKLLGVLLPQVETIAIAGTAAGATRLSQVGLAFDSSLAHAAAARWAREHAGELVDLVNSTSERTIAEITSNWIETPGATIGDLTAQLAPVLEGNAERAFTVGVTETTRSFAAGEAIVYAQTGIPRPVFQPAAHPRCHCWTAVKRLRSGEWVVVWMTNRNEVVCRSPLQTPWGRVEGCRALHNVVISEGPYLGRKVTEIG